jgi:hypothetical protein
MRLSLHLSSRGRPRGRPSWLAFAARRRNPREDGDPGAVPVSPDRPREGAGGAAAELEFGED